MTSDKQYFEELIGLSANCNTPYCSKQALSTGWAYKDDDPDFQLHWVVEYMCEDDGDLWVGKPETDTLINRLEHND